MRASRGIPKNRNPHCPWYEDKYYIVALKGKVHNFRYKRNKREKNRSITAFDQ